METYGYILGLLAFIWVIYLSYEVNTLKRKFRDSDIAYKEIDSLRNVVEKSIGKMAYLSSELGYFGSSFSASDPVMLLDVDEEWVLVRSEKKAKKGKSKEATTEQLIRLSTISSIKF